MHWSHRSAGISNMSSLNFATASSAELNLKPRIFSLMQGNRKKSEGAKSGPYTVPWMGYGFYNNIVQKLNCPCRIIWIFCGFWRNFSMTIGPQIVVYHSAVIVHRSSSGIQINGPVFPKMVAIIFLRFTFVGFDLPGNTHGVPVHSSRSMFRQLLRCHTLLFTGHDHIFLSIPRTIWHAPVFALPLRCGGIQQAHSLRTPRRSCRIVLINSVFGWCLVDKDWLKAFDALFRGERLLIVVKNHRPNEINSLFFTKVSTLNESHGQTIGRF